MAAAKPETEKSKRPANTAFKQQNLKAWRPILTPKAVIITFFVVGFIFVPIGVAVYITSRDIVEIQSANYVPECCVANCDSLRSDERVDRNPCTISLHVDHDMDPPVYMYYKLTSFYQNHRMYIKSRDDAQLGGESGLKPSDTELFCKSGDGNVGWAVNYDNKASENNTLSNAVSPCGLIANSFFNDSLRMVEILDDGYRAVDQTSEGISWESDRDTKFKNARDGSSGNNFLNFVNEKVTTGDCELLPNRTEPTAEQRQACLDAKDDAAEGQDPGWCYRGSGFCIEDEHFIVWMRTAGLPSFRKLYAKIDEKLYKDRTYEVQIWNGIENDPQLLPPSVGNIGSNDSLTGTLYPVHTFNGEKFIVLSTTAWIGGKNDFLGIAYIVVGSICLALAVAFFIKDRISPRDFAGNSRHVSS